jgi:16S rRNA (cytidine1402-2'-O)-methyltransferase
MAELYIVATPIGNMGDITLRAIEVLKSVDIIAAEDTRKTKILCEKYDIKTRLISYHKYSEKERAELFLKYLGEGKNIALVTDAGTPLISDPGSILVQKVRKEGFKITPVAGACALTTLLSSVERDDESFKFIGFLPKNEMQIKDIISKNRGENLVFYESPKRLIETLKIISEISPNAKIAIGRELTKKFEEILVDNIQTILEHFKNSTLKGEIVAMVYGQKDQIDDKILEEKIEKLKKLGLKNKDISAILPVFLECGKNKIYDMCLDCKVL